MKFCITLMALSVLALTLVGPGMSVQAASIINGDFSLGDTGFTTGYLTKDCEYPASYNILPNPRPCHDLWWNGYDHTTGDGLFLVANGANDQRILWAQEVQVEAGRNYIFSFWYCSVYAGAPAILDVRAEGLPLATVTLTPTVANWLQFI